MPVATATKAAPLSTEEKKILAELLKRSGQVSMAPKVGSQYQALVNLSVPRAGDPDKQCDLVPAGETVTLTDDEAALFLPPNKPIALIRPVKESGQELPRIPARALSGARRIPAGARPDPAGSTTVQVMQETVPEASPPVIGSENDGGPSLADQAAEIQDALDVKVKR